MTLVVLVGASGAGKTTIARAVAARGGPAVSVFHFDSIGVPPVAEMIRSHGSGEGWQRGKTIEWMQRLAGEMRTGEMREGFPVLFEGQTRFSFLADGALAAGDLDYEAILVDCSDEARSRRLRGERQQPELDNEDMTNWARYLRAQARDGGHLVLDTSVTPLSESVDLVMERLRLV